MMWKKLPVEWEANKAHLEGKDIESLVIGLIYVSDSKWGLIYTRHNGEGASFDM